KRSRHASPAGLAGISRAVGFGSLDDEPHFSFLRACDGKGARGYSSRIFLMVLGLPALGQGCKHAFGTLLRFCPGEQAGQHFALCIQPALKFFDAHFRHQTLPSEIKSWITPRSEEHTSELQSR